MAAVWQTRLRYMCCGTMMSCFYGTVLYFTIEDHRFRPMGVLVTILTSCLFGAILKEVFARHINGDQPLGIPARPRLTIDEIHCLNTYVFDRGQHCSRTTSPLHESLEELEEGTLQCCICLSEYEKGEIILELPCGHRYHMACVSLWLVKKAICPICKAVVTVERPAHAPYTAPRHEDTAEPNVASKFVPAVILSHDNSRLIVDDGSDDNFDAIFDGIHFA